MCDWPIRSGNYLKSLQTTILVVLPIIWANFETSTAVLPLRRRATQAERPSTRFLSPSSAASVYYLPSPWANARTHQLTRPGRVNRRRARSSTADTQTRSRRIAAEILRRRRGHEPLYRPVAALDLPPVAVLPEETAPAIRHEH